MWNVLLCLCPTNSLEAGLLTVPQYPELDQQAPVTLLSLPHSSEVNGCLATPGFCVGAEDLNP